MEMVKFDDRFHFDEEEVIWNANASEIFPSREFPEEFCLQSPDGTEVKMTQVNIEEADGDIGIVDYTSNEDVIKIRIFND